MSEKTSDQWQTPQWLFDELDQEFNFDIDLCATRENSKCNMYVKDYLSDLRIVSVNDGYGWELVDTIETFIKDENIKTCFMNPPYSNPKPFIEKAWEDSKYCKIVCLVKCDPSTRWWATFWEYSVNCPFCLSLGVHLGASLHSGRYIDCNYCKGTGKYSGPKPGCEVRFFPKRVKFEPPQSLGLEIVGNKYKIKCDDFETIGSSKNSFLDKSSCKGSECLRCKGTGFRWANLAGASFPCALIIMDRRHV